MRKFCGLLIGVLFAFPFDSLSAGAVATRSYPPLPEAVTSFGAVAEQGWLYVFGGHLGKTHEYSSNEVSGACRRLNLQNGLKWEDLPPGAPAQSPALVANDGWLYRIGGMAARNSKGSKHDLHSHATVERLRLDATGSFGRSWDPMPDLPAARSSHDAVVIGDKLFVAGGWTLAGTNSSTQWRETALILDLSKPDAKWTNVPQPFKRRGLCLAALGSKVYCLGGMTDGDSTSLAVDIYDVNSGEWTKGPALPPGKLKGFGNSACVGEGSLYVSGMSGTIWRLNKTSAWEEFAKLQTARFFHRLVPGIDGALLAVGGQGENEKLRDVEIVVVP